MRAFLVSLFLVVTAQVYAQQSYRVSGVVIDTLSQPIPGAVVTLTTQNQIIAAVVTDAEGGFSTLSEARSVMLEISHIQYNKYERQLNLVDDTELGVIVLHETSHILETVVVTTDILRRRGANYSVSLRNNPAAEGKSALSFMNSLPGVRGLSINGRESSIVFINGRQQRLPEPDLMRYLAALRAEDVESIQIMPSGGSKYTADHKGGVIRIQLRRSDERLFAGSVSVPIQLNTHDGAVTSNIPLSLNYTTTKLASHTFLSGSYLQNEAERAEYYVGDNTEYLSSSRNYYAVVFDQSFLYDIAKNHTVGVALNSMIKPDEGSTTDTRTADELLLSTISDHTSLYRGGGTVTYKWTFDDRKSNIHVAADYLYHQDGYNSLYQSAKLTPEKSRSTTDKNTFSVSADGELNFADRVSSLNVGAQYLQMSATQRYTQYNQSNYFDYREAIGSLYTDFSTSFADGLFDLSAGLRFEVTNLAWDYSAVDTTRPDNFDQYFNLFPSFSLTYNAPSGKYFTSLEYERSIMRPLMADYNPLEYREGDNIYVVGASSLLPQFENVISLTQSINKTNMLVLSYTQNRDLYDTVYTTEGDDLYITYGNFGSSHRLELYGDTRFWIVKRWLQMRLSASGNYTRFNHSEYGNINTLGGTTTASLSLSLPKSWGVSVSGNYKTPTETPIQRISEFWGLNAAVSKTIGGNLSLELSATNLLYNKSFTTTSRREGVDFHNFTRNYFQSVTISVGYKFGSSKLQGVKRAKTNAAVRQRSATN
jgi:hypothetical protein